MAELTDYVKVKDLAELKNKQEHDLLREEVLKTRDIGRQTIRYFDLKPIHTYKSEANVE